MVAAQAAQLADAALVCICTLDAAPYQAEKLDDRWELVPSESLTVAAACTLPCCLVQIVRQEGYVGFRLPHVAERYVQYSPRTRRFILASERFGVYEQLKICQVQLVLPTRCMIALLSCQHLPLRANELFWSLIAHLKLITSPTQSRRRETLRMCSDTIHLCRDLLAANCGFAGVCGVFRMHCRDAAASPTCRLLPRPAVVHSARAAAAVHAQVPNTWAVDTTSHRRRFTADTRAAQVVGTAEQWGHAKVHQVDTTLVTECAL